MSGPIRYDIISYKEILSFINDPDFSEKTFEEYLNGGRQDIFQNPDIFKENCRTVNEQYKNFELFEYTTDDPDVYVFPLYLELFQYRNKIDEMKKCIDHYCNKHNNKTVVFYWNQDIDFTRYNNFIKQYTNAKVINYNTFEKSPNDIIVPFWTLNTKQYKVKKKYNYGLIATMSHPCRQWLLDSFKNDPYFFYGQGFNKEDYYKITSSMVFNFCPRGAGLSSWRFFESFHLNTIPVLFTNKIVLPYDIDYTKYCVIFTEEQAKDRTYILNILKNIDYLKMLINIDSIREKFTLKGVQEEVYKNLIIGE